jgi:hypothetical protein
MSQDNMMPGSFSDDGDGGPEGYVTEERAEELFTAGLQAMREMLARFVEHGGTDAERTIAQSMRANWNPSWGKDPGRPEEVAADCWSA